MSHPKPAAAPESAAGATWTYGPKPAYNSSSNPNQRWFAGHGPCANGYLNGPANAYDETASIKSDVQVYRDAKHDLVDLSISIPGASIGLSINLDAEQLERLAKTLLDAAQDLRLNHSSQLLAEIAAAGAA